MKITLWTCALLLLVAAGCSQKTERELAQARAELADYKASKQIEIAALKSELERTKKALAEAGKSGADRASEFVASAQAELDRLKELAANTAAKAAEATRRAAAQTKRREAIEAELQQVKAAMATQQDKIDSLVADLARLKKLLGR